MDFNFTREENEFREEVTKWLKENLPHNISEKVRSYKRLSKEDYEIFMKKLSQKGWLAINWPVEYGGTGWSTIQKHIFELYLHRVLTLLFLELLFLYLSL